MKTRRLRRQRQTLLRRVVLRRLHDANLEAMAAEAHVIASDTAPVREVIEDGRNGRLVDFFDIKGWSRTLTEALADPAAGVPLRAAARRDVIARYDLRSQSLPCLMDFVENAGQ